MDTDKHNNNETSIPTIHLQLNDSSSSNNDNGPKQDERSISKEEETKSNLDDNHGNHNTTSKYLLRLKSNLFLRQRSKSSVAATSDDLERGAGALGEMVLDDDSNRSSSRPMCSICLRHYQVGDDICWSHNASCNHFFHEECIAQWLLRHNECPCCRRNYMEVEEDQEDDEEERQQSGTTTAHDGDVDGLLDDLENGVSIPRRVVVRGNPHDGGNRGDRRNNHHHHRHGHRHVGRQHHHRLRVVENASPIQSTGGTTPGSTRRFRFLNSEAEISLVDTQFLLALQRYADVIRVARSEGILQRVERSRQQQQEVEEQEGGNSGESNTEEESIVEDSGDNSHETGREGLSNADTIVHDVSIELGDSTETTQSLTENEGDAV